MQDRERWLLYHECHVRNNWRRNFLDIYSTCSDEAAGVEARSLETENRLMDESESL